MAMKLSIDPLGEDLSISKLITDGRVLGSSFHYSKKLHVSVVVVPKNWTVDSDRITVQK